MALLECGTSTHRSGPALIRYSLAIVALILSMATIRAQVSEYYVKAAFLYNFARYVEWPSQTFHSPNDPIVICVLGQNPFGHALDEAIRGKAVDGRPLVAVEIPEVRPGCGCQVLFVSAAERKRFQSAAEDRKESAILTVGETPGFAKEGGMINFRLEDGKIRFEINVDAAGRAHLRISSKLLNLAEIVKK